MYFFILPDLWSFMVYTTAMVGGLYFKANLMGMAGSNRPSMLGTA
jgi:hypothetical protein